MPVGPAGPNGNVPGKGVLIISPTGPTKRHKTQETGKPTPKKEGACPFRPPKAETIDPSHSVTPNHLAPRAGRRMHADHAGLQAGSLGTMLRGPQHRLLYTASDHAINRSGRVTPIALRSPAPTRAAPGRLKLTCRCTQDVAHQRSYDSHAQHISHADTNILQLYTV